MSDLGFLQMSVAQLLNHHKSSRWLLTNGPPSIHRRTSSLKLEIGYFSKNTQRHRPLPSFLVLRAASLTRLQTRSLCHHIWFEIFFFLITDSRGKKKKKALQETKKKGNKNSEENPGLLQSGVHDPGGPTHIYVHTNEHVTHNTIYSHFPTYSELNNTEKNTPPFSANTHTDTQHEQRERNC